MNWADYVIIAIVVFSAAIGLIRGFVREALSLATWIGAFAVAAIFAVAGAALLGKWGVPGEQLRLVLAFAGIFALTLVCGLAVNHFAGLLVQRAKLAGPDRGLGLFFGIARGYVAVAALVVAASFTSVQRAPWYQGSALIPFTRPLAAWIDRHLPKSHLQEVS